LDAVAKLADVAWPGVVAEVLKRLAAGAPDAPAALRGEAANPVLSPARHDADRVAARRGLRPAWIDEVQQSPPPSAPDPPQRPALAAGTFDRMGAAARAAHREIPSGAPSMPGEYARSSGYCATQFNFVASTNTIALIVGSMSRHRDSTRRRRPRQESDQGTPA